MAHDETAGDLGSFGKLRTPSSLVPARTPDEFELLVEGEVGRLSRERQGLGFLMRALGSKAKDLLEASGRGSFICKPKSAPELYGRRSELG